MDILIQMQIKVINSRMHNFGSELTSNSSY